MNSELAIKLIIAHGDAAADRALGEEYGATEATFDRTTKEKAKAAKALLEALLGREPTVDEVNRLR